MTVTPHPQPILAGRAPPWTALLSLGLLLGCNADLPAPTADDTANAPTAALRIAWTVAFDGDPVLCGRVIDLRAVRVEVTGLGIAEPREERPTCEDGEVTLYDLPYGSYTALLTALDGNGLTLGQSEAFVVTLTPDVCDRREAGDCVTEVDTVIALDDL